MPGGRMVKLYDAGQYGAGNLRSRYRWSLYHNRRSKVARIAKEVKRIKKAQEVKQYTGTGSGTAVSNASSFGHLTQIAEGDDYTGRTGRKIAVKALQYKAIVKLPLDPQASANNSNVVRLILAQDTEAAGSAITTSSFFSTAPPSHALALKTADPNVHNRYRVLYDKSKRMSFLNDNQVVTFDYYKKWKEPKIVKFSGTAAGDEGHGGIFRLVCSDESLTNTAPEYQDTWRVSYTDS